MLRQPGSPLLLAAAGACLALALLSAPALADNGVGCINDDGMYRDFIVAWKLPDGAEYVYFDPYMQAPQKSQYTLDSSTEGFLANTLNQVYSADKDKVGYVQYNDEWPDDHKHGTGGHAKGFFGFDENQGFWLQHSVPRFPEFVSKGYPGLPEEEFTYGQHFLCITMGLNDMNSLANQILTAYAWVYEQNIPEDFPAIQNLRLLASGERDDNGGSNTFSFTSIPYWNTYFDTFYKAPSWGKYLYEDFVEVQYQDDFTWETWMNGINPDPSFCAGDSDGHLYNSTNIRVLKIGDTKFKETQDHSKWGISTGPRNQRLVCLGDINRQESQNKRGGGTTCLANSALWQYLSSAIQDQDCCCDRGSCNAYGWCVN